MTNMLLKVERPYYRRHSELIGAEHLLAKRAVNQGVADKIWKITKDFEDYFKIFGYDVRAGDPSPGNFEGGITTLEEKSLGCIKKTGNSSIIDVEDIVKQLDNIHGLIIMDTESHDPSSVAAMARRCTALHLFKWQRNAYRKSDYPCN